MITQEALDAAAAELGRQFHGGAPDPDDIKLASDVLLAAAPLIAAAERERIIGLAREKQATYWIGPEGHPAPRRPFALFLQFGDEDGD